jgi:uncharacterized membrane protein YdjX (TVP38/TMEM64 family)
MHMSIYSLIGIPIGFCVGYLLAKAVLRNRK